MSIVQCRECAGGVSSEAQVCPHCGKQLYVPRGCLGNVAIVLLCLVGGFILLAILSGVIEGTKHTDPAEEAAKEKKWDDLDKAVIGLRAQLRNPDSLKFSEVLQMPDDAVCMHYRAQNGFGGMNVSRAVSLGNTGTIPVVALEETDDPEDSATFRSAWNRECAGKTGIDRMEDMTIAMEVLSKHEHQ